MMMEEKNDSKKILLSVIGVAILVVAVVGISFAVTNLVATSDPNTISTGTITMSYSEPQNGINLVNATPIDDTAGSALTENFDFTVSTGASGSVNIPYEINVTEIEVDAGKTKLEKSEVKVYLSKKDESSTETSVVAPKLLSELEASTLRTGSFKLYEATDSYTNGGSTTTNYVLRMWVDSSVAVDSIKDKQYKLLVNVDSNVQSLR